jgi:hypothetical protein
VVCVPWAQLPTRSDQPPELVGCAVVANVGPGALVAPSANDILVWEPYLVNSPILYAERVSTTRGAGGGGGGAWGGGFCVWGLVQ